MARAGAAPPPVPRLRGGAAVLAALLLVAAWGGARHSPTGPPPAPATTGASEAGNVQAPGGEDGLSEGGSELVDVDAGFRLVSASVVSADLDDDEEEFVRFDFAGPVEAVVDGTRLRLQGLDPRDVLAAVAGYRDETAPASLLVAFPPGTDVASFRLAVALAGAVENVRGAGSAPGAVPLAGVPDHGGGGRTVGPELVEVRIRPSLDRADFVFDAALDERTAPSPKRFGYHDAAGRVHRGAAVVSVEDRVAVVHFDGRRGDQVEEARRWFVLPGAVRDRTGHPGRLDAVGGPTSAPDLLAVLDAPGATQWDLVFDAPVTGPVGARIHAHTPAGNRYPAATFSRPAATVVRAAFPGVADFGHDVVVVTTGVGAVRATNGFATPATAGARPVGSAPHPGPTLGPDLGRVEVDDASGQVIFVFDEHVNDRQRPRPGDFRVITASGRQVPARHVVEVTGAAVIVTFDPAALRAARAVVAGAGAVTDFEGQPNPLASSSTGADPTPARRPAPVSRRAH